MLNQALWATGLNMHCTSTTNDVRDEVNTDTVTLQYTLTNRHLMRPVMYVL